MAKYIYSNERVGIYPYPPNPSEHHIQTPPAEPEFLSEIITGWSQMINNLIWPSSSSIP